MNKLRVLIADDHQIFRAGIINLLEKETGFEIVGQASDGDQAVHLAKELEPDVILMDIHFTGTPGITAIAKINNEITGVKILAFTSNDDESLILDMIRSGAKGFVLKKASVEELVLAIRTIANGGSYFSKEISVTLFALLGKAEPVFSLKQKAKQLEITGRELEILQYIAAEMTNKEIASQLFISPRTVETHRRNLVQKLRVKNTAGLVRYYLDNLKQNSEQLVK